MTRIVITIIWAYVIIVLPLSPRGDVCWNAEAGPHPQCLLNLLLSAKPFQAIDMLFARVFWGGGGGWGLSLLIYN